MDILQNLINEHSHLVTIIVLVSVVTILGSMVALPWLIISLPEDYFSNPARRHHTDMSSAKRIAYMLLKNLLGFVLLLAGIAMLVLPGQGLLTILGGLLLIDFPGKYSLECHLAGRNSVMRTLNWIRRKASKPVFSDPVYPKAG